MYNALTVDLEEYFHPTEVAAAVDASSWEGLPSRVGAATRSVLEILGRRDVRATFFVLGWVAERYPRLVREVVAAGHEIGCHGYAHRLVYLLTPEEFEQDTRRAQRAIADACGVMPRLYRAASYSITSVSLWALDVLAHCGFTCDSSIYPFPTTATASPAFPDSRWCCQQRPGRFGRCRRQP